MVLGEAPILGKGGKDGYRGVSSLSHNCGQVLGSAGESRDFPSRARQSAPTDGGWASPNGVRRRGASAFGGWRGRNLSRTCGQSGLLVGAGEDGGCRRCAVLREAGADKISVVNPNDRHPVGARRRVQRRAERDFRSDEGRECEVVSGEPHHSRYTRVGRMVRERPR